MIIKTLIISANIGTLFEETHLISGWVEEVEKIFLQYDPNFIGISFQVFEVIQSKHHSSFETDFSPIYSG